MNHDLSNSFVIHFSEIADPRRKAGLRYPLIEILFIAICAIIAGADDWVAIERFGKAKIEWFKKYLRLKHGIPSHDTFGDVFGVLDPEQFAQAFTKWMNRIAEVAGVIALDRKNSKRLIRQSIGKNSHSYGQCMVISQ